MYLHCQYLEIVVYLGQDRIENEENKWHRKQYGCKLIDVRKILAHNMIILGHLSILHITFECTSIETLVRTPSLFESILECGV